MKTMIVLVLIAAAIPILAAPSVIATARRSPDRNAIVALNLAGVAAFSCWAAALAWALFGSRDQPLGSQLKSRGLVPLAVLAALVLIPAGIWISIRTWASMAG